MKRLVSPPVVGGVTVLLAFGSIVFAFTAQRHVPGRTYTYVSASVDQLGPALRVGNDVRIRGVRIGEVKSIGFADGKPRVDLQLDGRRDLYRDATAFIASRSALGQKFVALEPGHADKGPLAPGAVLTPGAAGDATDLDSLLIAFDPATRKALGSAVRDIGSGTSGHSQDINDALGSAPGLLDDGAGVSAALSSDQAHLAEVLADAQRLSARLTDKKSEIAASIGQSATTLNALGTDNGAPLKVVLADLPDTLTKTRAALTSLQTPLTDLKATVRDLRPAASTIGAHTGQIRSFLRGYVDPLGKLAAIAPQLDTSVVSLTGLMTDARPLAAKLHRTGTLANTPLSVLEPYSPEVSLWFKYFTSVLADSDANGHWLRIDVFHLGSESISGTGPLGTALKDPLVSRNAYPAPGAAQSQTRGGIAP